MPNTQKIERVAELKERIEASEALLLTDYRGLSVTEITELRRSLREGGARFAVIKNTLMRRALEGTDAAHLGSLFEGPSAVAFVDADPVAAAKSVTAAAKKYPTLVLKGGFVEGRVLDADQAKALADLDSREVMLSKLAGMMKSEISRAAAAFQATQARFLSLLEAFRAKLPAETTTDQPSAAEQPASEETRAHQEAEAPGNTPEPEDATTETSVAGSDEEAADEQSSGADPAASDGEE